MRLLGLLGRGDLDNGIDVWASGGSFSVHLEPEEGSCLSSSVEIWTRCCRPPLFLILDFQAQNTPPSEDFFSQVGWKMPR